DRRRQRRVAVAAPARTRSATRRGGARRRRPRRLRIAAAADALRRPAAAGRDCARARPSASPHPRRRADRQPRPCHRRARPRAFRRAGARARRGVSARDALARRGGACRPQRDADAERDRGVSFALLRQLSWPELRHHPWRHVAALLAVTLGVALAFSVHLINASALAEFGAAVRAINGDADLELVGPRSGFDETLYGGVAKTPGVAVASPVVEAETFAFDAAGRRVPIRVVGIDAFVVARLAPAMLPRPRAGSDRFAAIDPGVVFLNAAAERRFGSDATTLALQTPQGRIELRVAGGAAGGPPLAAMDIAGAQVALGMLGRVQRIDVRLASGADRDAVVASLRLPPGVRAGEPGEAGERVSNVSRAYRVNLTVLALVAMFTGAFLVFSILALSVAQRAQSLALLAVL